MKKNDFKTPKNRMRWGIVFTILVFAFILLFESSTEEQTGASQLNPLSYTSNCGGETAWIPLPAEGGVLASGNYYLDGNVTLLSNITVTSGTVNIDLNGNILWGTLNSDLSIFTVTNATLNIYDCDTSNKVHSYKIKEVKANSTQDIYYNNASYSNKLFQRYYDFNDIGDGFIVGGVITGGHKFSTMTDLKDNFYYEGGGSAILVGDAGIVNFFGGSLSGNTSTALSQWGGKRERSGTVGIIDGGTFNFHDGQIIGNSSRYGGAGIYLFGASDNPARANIYGGIITDNYAFDVAYNFVPTSSMYLGGAAIGTDNIGTGASLLSLAGNPKIINNQFYDYATNAYIKTNLSYSTESANSIRILDKLYVDVDGVRDYASIGLWGGAGSQLTSDYTESGHTHDDVNKIFFADNTTQAVAYNTSNGELKYVTNDLKTLTYSANNGTSDTTNISVVDKITVRDIMFVKPGHTFLHWNTSVDDTGIEFEKDDLITLTENQTLYAIWAKSTYTISYESNGGTLDSNVETTYTYGDTITLPVPTWGTYIFDGWYDNPMLTGGEVTEISSSMLGNQTFYAKWSGVNYYTITSTSGINGSIFPSGSIIFDGTSQDYQIMPEAGYKVDAFLVDGDDHKLDLINNNYTVTGITKNTLIEVTFTKILSTDITVYAAHGEGGTISPSGYIVVSSGGSIEYSITPNPDYMVDKVTVNGINLGSVNHYSMTNITSSQTIQVTFKKIVYFDIEWYLDGGAFGDTDDVPLFASLGTNITEPNNPTKEGHTFVGWYRDALFTNAYTFGSMPANDVEIYAKWDVNDYTISFNSNGGSVVNSIKEAYGSAVNEPDAPTKLGYTFLGWYQDEALTNAYSFTTIQENETLYAKWSLNNYTIHFNTAGGSVIDSITQAYGASVSEPTKPTKPGYTFWAWYGDEALTQTYTFSTMPASDITLYAQWTINNYTIRFISVGGTAVSDITQGFGTVVAEPTEPTKLGYTFAGWYSDIEYTDEYTFTTMPAHNNQLYAQWIINHYTITFETNGGSDVTALTIAYDSWLSERPSPTKLGYEFSGWYTDEALTNAFAFGNMPAEDFTVYAKWTIGLYSISFITNGGSLVSTITQTYGSTVTKPEDPTRLGYEFLGWIKSYNPVVHYTFDTMPAENITVYAMWNAISYSITFNSNGGSDVYTRHQSIGTTVIEPDQPTKLGYTFAGWYADETLTMLYIFDKMPAEDFTLYAKWIANEYTVTFNSNGGSAVESITLGCGTTLSEPLQPTKLGYTFDGWYTDVELTNAYVFDVMGPQNLTLYAKWLVNHYTITFDTKGGSIITPINQAYGSPIVTPTHPTKAGYTFNGWSQVIPATMPAQNTVIVAYWLKTEVINGGDVESNVDGLVDSIDESLLENKDAEVVIQIDQTIASEVSQDIIDIIKTYAEKRDQYGIIDIRVIIRASGEADVLVHELSQNITITISIPESEQGYKNYRILRIHEGESEILETVYNEDNQTLTFETDRFSNYVILYEVSNNPWAWWLLLLIIPVGFAGVYYRDFIVAFIRKVTKRNLKKTNIM